MSDNVDAYATPRANLRENVKTMSTILAGTAGAVIAGSPFSGIGALDLLSLRFLAAVVGLATVAVCLYMGWKELTFMLRPDLLNPIILRDSFTNEQIQQLGLPPAETEELLHVKAEFDRTRSDLLPEKINSYEAFEKYLDDEWQEIETLKRRSRKRRWTRPCLKRFERSMRSTSRTCGTSASGPP